jgi:hypothetical protein
MGCHRAYITSAAASLPSATLNLRSMPDIPLFKDIKICADWEIKRACFAGVGAVIVMQKAILYLYLYESSLDEIEFSLCFFEVIRDQSDLHTRSLAGNILFHREKERRTSSEADFNSRYEIK